MGIFKDFLCKIGVGKCEETITTQEAPSQQQTMEESQTEDVVVGENVTEGPFSPESESKVGETGEKKQ